MFYILIPNWMNWLDSVFIDLWILFLMPLSIKPVLLEHTSYWIHWMLSLTIGIFEGVWIWFAFFGFKGWRINFVVCFAAPTKFAVILWLVRSTALYTFWALNSARESRMTPFPTVFTLRNTRVCISYSNCRNISSDIETPINKAFSLDSTLGIPNVNLYNHYIRLGRYFDYPQFRGKGNVVEDLILLNDIFNIFWWETFLWVVASMWII